MDTRIDKSSYNVSQSGDKVVSTKSMVDLDTGSTYSTYKATVVPHQLIIQRTLTGGLSSGGGSLSRSTADRFRSVMVPGVHLATKEVDSARFTRDREKKDMQDLNLRLTRYIETVRFLEAQNKQLDNEIKTLKAKWGKETSQVRAMFEADLEEARRIKDDLEKDTAKLEIRISSVIEALDVEKRRFSHY